MDRRFCVYLHYVQGEDHPFYVGEGTSKRARSCLSRNRWWRFKVAKHGGFSVRVLRDGLTKQEAEALEVATIKELRDMGVKLTNVCDGPMFSTHWLVGRPREDHPMWGKRFSAPWISESNIRRTGSKLQPRPDLSERNRLKKFNHYTKPVRCVETGNEYSSVKGAALAIGALPSKISSVLNKPNKMHRGVHWVTVVKPTNTGQ